MYLDKKIRKQSDEDEDDGAEPRLELLHRRQVRAQLVQIPERVFSVGLTSIDFKSFPLQGDTSAR